MAWWDPRESSMFTGAGTPWGAPDNPNPTKPNYATDPNTMQGYNYDPMKKALEQGIREQRARRDQGSRMGLVGANPYGGTKGSAASQVYGQSAAKAEGDISAGIAGLDKQAYDEKTAAMISYNDALRAEYEAAMKRRQREEDQRAAWGQKAGSILTAGLGD